MIDLAMHGGYQIADVGGKQALVCQFGRIFAEGDKLIAVMPGCNRRDMAERASKLSRIGQVVNDTRSGTVCVQLDSRKFNAAAAILKPLPAAEKSYQGV